jgi:hypothetical protein
MRKLGPVRDFSGYGADPPHTRWPGNARAAALEMPRKLRINAVSPPWVKETMIKFGMDPTPGIAAAECAKAYVAAVEGAHRGKILDAAKLADSRRQVRDK